MAKGTALTPEELKREKDKFLERYNPYRTDCQAASDAVKSASQHNALYAVSFSERERACVRETWKALLCELAHKYRRTIAKSQYELDIETLKQRMNKRFRGCLRGAASGRNQKCLPKKQDVAPLQCSDGFKVSHAQKSLSVFLKHLWCMGRIAIPRQCPVDARILARGGLRDHDTRWTYVNSMEEHRCKVAFLDKCARASGLTLAEWELKAFQT